MLSNPSPKPNPKPNPELKPTPKPTPTPKPKPKPKQVAARNAVEAHEAKTGRVTSTVDRKDAAPQAKLLFQKALAMVEANHGRSEMVFPKDILWLAGAPGAGKGTLPRRTAWNPSPNPHPHPHPKP